MPDFASKTPSTHHMCVHDHLFHTHKHKMFSDSQMSRIKYIYYINMSLKTKAALLQNGTTEDSITPQEQQLGQRIA
jgi:hypothetical protein